MDIQNKLMVRFPEKPMLMLFHLFSITVIKCCLTKSSWGKKSLCSECFMRGKQGTSRQELRAVNWYQELKQRPWDNTAFWLAPTGLFSLLSYSPQDHHRRVAPPTVCLVLPPQPLMKKCPYYKPVKWKHFLNWGVLWELLPPIFFKMLAHLGMVSYTINAAIKLAYAL